MNKQINLASLLFINTIALCGLAQPAPAQDGRHFAPAGSSLIATKENNAVIRPFAESEFVTVDKVKEMPESVRKALGQLLISDAGGPFNAGCCVDSSKPVPMNRLVFAASSKKLCVMHFEKGGIAHIFKVACYGLTDDAGKPLDQAKLLWQSNLTSNKLSSLAELNQKIRDGAVKPAQAHDF